MTYNLCKMLITKGNYEKVDMTQKLDVFLLNNRITEVQYNELVGLMG
ncbi:MAG: hypothetical protein ACK5MV_07675 [Aminipila sp.]